MYINTFQDVKIKDNGSINDQPAKNFKNASIGDFEVSFSSCIVIIDKFIGFV